MIVLVGLFIALIVNIAVLAFLLGRYSQPSSPGLRPANQIQSAVVQPPPINQDSIPLYVATWAAHNAGVAGFRMGARAVFDKLAKPPLN